MSQELVEYLKANPLVGVTDPLVSDQLAWIVAPTGGSTKCTGTRVIKRKGRKRKGNKKKQQLLPCRRIAVTGRALCDQCLVAAGFTLDDQKELQTSVGQKKSRAKKVSRATLGRTLAKVREHVANRLNAEHAISRSEATGATLADAIQVDSDSAKDDDASVDESKQNKMAKALNASPPRLRPADLAPVNKWPTRDSDAGNLRFQLTYVDDKTTGAYGGDDTWFYHLKVSCPPNMPAADPPRVFRCLSAVSLFCPHISEALLAQIDNAPQWAWASRRALAVLGEARQVHRTLRAAVRCLFSDPSAYPILDLATSSPDDADAQEVERKIWEPKDFRGPWTTSPVSTGRRGALACVVRLLGKATWVQQQFHLARRAPNHRNGSKLSVGIDDAMYANGLLVRLLCHGVYLARSVDGIGQQDLQIQLHRLDALDFPMGALPSNSPTTDTTPLWSLPATRQQPDWTEGWDLSKSLQVVNKGDAGRALETTREVSEGARLLTVEFTALETGVRWPQLDGADTYRLKSPDSEACLAGEDVTLVMAPGSPCTLVQHPDAGPARGSPNVELVRGTNAFGSTDTYVFVASCDISADTVLTLNYGEGFHPNEGDLSILAAAAADTKSTMSREFRDMSVAVGKMHYNALNRIHANTIAENYTPLASHLLAAPTSVAAEAERTKRRERLAGTSGDLSATLTTVKSFQALAEDLRKFAEDKRNDAISFPTLAEVEAGTARPDNPAAGRFPRDGRRAGSRPWAVSPGDPDVHGLLAQEHKESANDLYFMKPASDSDDGTYIWEFQDHKSDVPYDENEDFGHPVMTVMSMQRGAEHTDLDPVTNERPPPGTNNLSLVDWTLRASEIPPRACTQFVRGGSDVDVLGPCVARVLHQQSREVKKRSASDLLGVGTPSLFATPPEATFYGSGLHMEPGHCTTRWSSLSGHSVLGAFDVATSELVTDFHAMVLGERVPRMFTDRIARCMTRSQWEALPPANALQPKVYDQIGFQPFVCSAPPGTIVFIPERYVHWLYAFPGSERIVSGGLPPALVLRNITGRQCTSPLLGRNKVDEDLDTTTFGVENESFSNVGSALADVLSGPMYSAQAARDNLTQWTADASAIARVSDTPEYQHAVQFARHPFSNRPDVCLFPNNLFVGCTRDDWRAITMSVSDLRKRYRTAEVQHMSLELGKMSMQFFGFDEWEGTACDIGSGDRFWLAANATAMSLDKPGYVSRKKQRACIQKAKAARTAALSILAAMKPSSPVGSAETTAIHLTGDDGANNSEDQIDRTWANFIQIQRKTNAKTHDLVIWAEAVATGQPLCIHDYPHDAMFGHQVTYVAFPSDWANDLNHACMGSVNGVRHVLRWGGDFFGLTTSSAPPTSNSSSSKPTKGNKSRGKRARDKDEREEDEREEDPKIDCDDSSTASDGSREEDSDESSS
jgi:hypothetical protein